MMRWTHQTHAGTIYQYNSVISVGKMKRGHVMYHVSCHVTLFCIFLYIFVTCLTECFWYFLSFWYCMPEAPEEVDSLLVHAKTLQVSRQRSGDQCHYDCWWAPGDFTWFSWQVFLDTTPLPALQHPFCAYRYVQKMCNAFGKKAANAVSLCFHACNTYNLLIPIDSFVWVLSPIPFSFLLDHPVLFKGDGRCFAWRWMDALCRVLSGWPHV